MRKPLLPLLFLLSLSTQLFASLRQTQYRWRNDDGNETGATFKAAANTAITVNDTNTLRLRLELNNDNTLGENSTVLETLEYSSDGGTVWTPITNGAGQAFKYVSSPNVADGAATTNLMGTATFGTFTAGRIIAAVPTATPMLLGDGQRTEFEWVIRPTMNVLPMSTYIFRSAGQEDIPAVYPQINTGCVGVFISSKQDSSRCGPGIVALSATSTPGTTVKWYESLVGGTEVATGNTLVTPLLSTTKIYYAAAALGTTCESPRVAVTAAINPIPAPNLGTDRTICEQDNLVLNPGSYAAYIWDDNSTSPTRTVTTGGTYFVTVTGTGNCKNSDTITVLSNPKPFVALGNDTAICPGVQLTLDAGNPGASFQWSDGLTSQTRQAGTAGNYEVTVTNSFGCKTTDLISVVIKDAPKGAINAIYGDTATYTFTVLDPMFAVGYIWNFGDGSPEETGAMVQHTYQSNGIYTVRLTIEGDCDSGNTVKTRTVDVYDAGGTTGIGKVIEDKSLRLYPNPADEMLTIESSAGLGLNEVAVFNMLGQRFSIAAGRAFPIRLSTAILAPGMYLLRIETDKGALLRKFEVRR